MELNFHSFFCILKYKLNKRDMKDLYIKAKEAYYQGNPIMSDEEFDNLEQEIRNSGKLEEMVGAKDKDEKFPHPTKMLSLSKFQADKTTGAAPTEQFEKWLAAFPFKTNHLMVTCKYDGNSGNCIYENGRLKQVLSRGDGFYGRDITTKIRPLMPDTIKYDDGIMEVRGEVIMRKSVFEKKYKDKFANPRNLVAGILGRDDNEMIEDLEFIAYDAKYKGEYLILEEINEMGFNKNYKPFQTIFDVDFDDFGILFQEMKAIREKEDFPLDGFVLKLCSTYRNIVGENDHDPNWGKAIKFKPVGATTEIVDIEWNIGRTGEFIPKAILKPIDIDGSTVSKVALYNAGYVVNNNIQPGTKIRVAKAGDIIPQIIEVFK